MTSGTLSKEEQKELFNLALTGTSIHCCHDDKSKLIRFLLTARETSYSPYSKFRVGAALMATDGTLFKGRCCSVSCNECISNITCIISTL